MTRLIGKAQLSKTLREHLIEDAREETAHDFGKNIIPRMIEQRRVYAFKFHDANKKAVQYWRDIGTLDAYWEANMDLVAVDPQFNLYDPEWPIRTYQGQFPPAKFVFAQDYQGGRMGVALDSIVCGGCIVSGDGSKTLFCPPTFACRIMLTFANLLSWKTSSSANIAAFGEPS